jgi:hypothetical protein
MTPDPDQTNPLPNAGLRDVHVVIDSYYYIDLTFRVCRTVEV